MISSEESALPDNWEIKYDFSTKRNFFVNHKTKTTTWNDPRKRPEVDKSIKTGIRQHDYVKDDADMEKVLKIIEKEVEFEKYLKRFSEQYSEFDKNYIQELLIKSKGNASTVDVILRQERRKESSSNISYSTIESGVSSSKSKFRADEQSRSSLSERCKYKAPETSKDRIKSSLRSEFTNVDNRIVDRVLEATEYDLERSRQILLKQNLSYQENYKDPEKIGLVTEDSPEFKKYFNEKSGNLFKVDMSQNKSGKSKGSLALGPDPGNRSGAIINKNKYKKI